MFSVAGEQVSNAVSRESEIDRVNPMPERQTTTEEAQRSDSVTSNVPEIRSCELCGATQTPMWRRGPSGKGSVCNACGVRWASRRRTPRKHVDDSHASHTQEQPSHESGSTGIALEQYYCKYCCMTWPLNYFKNRQQFGAHCSNCSRKRKSRESATSIHSGNVSADLAAQETSGFEATSSPTGPFLPHLNLRAAAAAASHPVPRKQPRADLHLLNATHQTMSHAPTSNLSMRHHSHGREWEGEDLGFEESAPPAAKRSKHAHNASSSVHHHLNLQNNISIDSGDESDSETALSPYGSTTSSLHRLLGAVENVLTEEREMASALAQLETVRTLIASVEETRKKTIGRLDQMLLSHLDTVQKLVSRESIESSILERAKAEADAREKAAMEDSLKQKNSEPQSETENKSGESNDNQSDSNQQRDANQREKRAVTAESQAEAAELAKRSENLVESAEARVESVMGPLRDQHHSILAPSTTLPVRLLSSLPSELESAATDLTTLFLNATLLQLGSQADVESFKQFFVQSLNQSKAQINVEVAQLFEALSALKTRQTQLGQNTFIDQLQLRNLSEDLHELKQRVVHASRAVQGAFVQLVSQFSEQIEAAKRVYQESAGNNVKLLDEIVRSQITPQLTAQIDISKQQLLAHVNCVRANLAYLDTLVLGTE